MNKEDSSLEWKSIEKAIVFFEKPITIYTNHLSWLLTILTTMGPGLFAELVTNGQSLKILLEDVTFE